jgi:hypothetical protein
MHIWGMFSLGSSGNGSRVLIGAQRERKGKGRDGRGKTMVVVLSYAFSRWLLLVVFLCFFASGFWLVHDML